MRKKGLWKKRMFAEGDGDSMQKRDVLRKLILACVLSFSLLLGGNTGLAASERQGPEIQWEKNYGPGINLIEVQATQDIGYTVMGTTYEDKVYLARSDEQGNEQWSKTFQLNAKNSSGTEKKATVTAFWHTRDGGYLLGGTVPGFHFRYNDYVIVKTDKYGEIQLKEVFDSGAYGHFNMIRETNDGGSVNVIFTESLNAGSFHTAAQKRDGSGKTEWTTVLGGGGPSSPNVYASSVQQTADGGYIVCGSKDTSFSIWKLNASGAIEWNKIYGFDEGHVVQTADGGYAIAGTLTAGDVVLTKTDTLGKEQWKKTIGGGSGKPISLENTTDGGYLIGTSQRVFKTDALASVQWSKAVSNMTKAVPTKDGGAAILYSPDTLLKLAGQSKPPQTGLKLDSEDYSLSIGQTLDTILTSVYGNQKINVTQYGAYLIADPSVASVDNSGNISGLKYGQTVLTATYNGSQARANVYVYGGATGSGSELKLDSEDYSLSAGSTLDTVLRLTKDGKTTKVTGLVTYSTADPSVATIDAMGNITGLKQGVTVLTVINNGLKTIATVYVY
ncbi:Ig-like domain-containing protein [Paenibacillus piri]|uniref:BIG2 domain-containing protein n=1 Tax=Paenibacillus piri TaxID=2547395 RepID=A0A4V2ZT30_9BACL|nr:Ig-like domain-containing protein [Paenibacillus piri]TDF95484.1 hypothetical protein E1757_20490 [Paenibacillus piri]